MQSELKTGIRDGGLLRAFFHIYAINLSIPGTARLEGGKRGRGVKVVLFSKVRLPWFMGRCIVTIRTVNGNL